MIRVDHTNIEKKTFMIYTYNWLIRGVYVLEQDNEPHLTIEEVMISGLAADHPSFYWL